MLICGVTYGVGTAQYKDREGRQMSRKRTPSITHVSDTALWVATFRALEGQRSDAAFDDPLAALLADGRGRAIASAFSRADLTAWVTTVRTSATDQLIYEALRDGIDTVLNLGAGLDARPYRLNLPKALHWIEVDFPHIVNLKNTKLINYQPVCRVERIGMDLLDRSSRQDLFARYGSTSKSILVITEGVISYLSVYDASMLATDLHGEPSMNCWIQDFENGGTRTLPRGWAKNLKSAPFLFEVRDWFEFFKKYGWQASKIITSFEESKRINRPYPFDFPYGLIMRAIPKGWRQRILSLTGVVLMKQSCLI
jgi:methyltransferase (TIGR00027 family)